MLNSYDQKKKKEEAGYPYTGGLYGGYSDKANNQPSTFAGPRADIALKGVTNGLTSAARNSLNNYQSSVNDTLTKTRKAYGTGGLGAAAGQYVRGTIADAGTALNEGVVKPIASPALSLSRGISNFGKTLLTGDPNPVGTSLEPPASMARKAITGEPKPPTPQPFKSTLPNGITMTGDQQGNRTYTMGTKGQDGYGFMSVRGGQMGNPVARRQLLGQQTPGYSFEGSSADAAKFFAPVSRPAPTPATLGAMGGDYRQIRDAHEAGKISQQGMPQYLGPESGLGWKTREKLYETQMDAYNKATGNKAQMDIASMQEAGAGRRSLLQAQGINDRNALDAARLVGDQGMQALEMQGKQMELDQAGTIKAARNKLSGLPPGSPEYTRQERLLALLSGKSGEQKPVYQTIKEEDSSGNVRERLYRVDGDTMAEVTPVLTESDVARQVQLLRGMKDEDRQKHLQELAQWNPKLYDALVKRPTGGQSVKSQPVEPSYGLLQP